MFSNNKLACKNQHCWEPDPDLPEKIIDVVTKAVKNGEITEKRINESYNRIMKLKKEL